MSTSLSAPLTLPGGAVLHNRIAKAAMSENLADDHLPGERLLRLYGRWSHAGAGLLLTGNVMVDRRALGEPRNVVVESDAAVDALRRWADVAQAGGAACWPQVNHPGRQGARQVSSEMVAPSAVPLKIGGGLFGTPRALEATEIEDLVGRFGRVAGWSKRAGFAGVQVHGAHGYLVSQFLSPLVNQRDDAWGGDAERRRRFLVEVVRAMRAEVGAGFPIGVKLNSADFQRGGFDEAESMAVVEVLEAEGVDLLEISGGTYERPAMMAALPEQKASTAAREAYFLRYAQAVRARTRMPLLLTGGFRTRTGMEAALASGAVDMVGLGRPMALEPDLPRRLLDGSATESRATLHLTGLKPLDGVSDIAWYAHQLRRMGDGKEPDPEANTLAVLARLGWNAATGG